MRAYGVVGRGLGLIVFLAGIAMLAGVFWFGFKIFENPGFAAASAQAAAGAAAPNPAASSAASILPRLTVLLVQLAFLLAMCVAASLIASKGIQLYAAGDSGHSHRPGDPTDHPVVLTRSTARDKTETKAVSD